MELVSTKILVAVLFAIFRFAAGTIPIKIYSFLQGWQACGEGKKYITSKRRHQLVDCCIALCQSFGGGVLFATCLLHMMPEVYYSLDKLRKYGEYTSNYPHSQLMICAGFFIVYFVEEFAQWIVSVIPQKFCERSSSATSNTKENKIAPDVEENEGQLAIISVPDDNYSLDHEIDEKVQEQNKKNLEKSDEKDDSQLELLHQEVKTQQQMLRCILAIAALSLHAFFEGFAIGLQQSFAKIWYTFIAVSIHSCIILFCMSLELLLVNVRTRSIVINTAFLAVPGSLGVIIGLVVVLASDPETKASAYAVLFIEGLSAGTILYITFFEVLNREKERRVYRLRRAFCILAGFTLMALLQLIEYSK